MKKLIYAIALISNLIASSQSFKVFTPLRTYHWNRDKEMLAEYSGTEGGNVGLVLITRFEDKKFFQDIQTGVIRNSFGNTSFLTQYGIGRNLTKDLNISLNVGLISGYERLYEINTDLKTVFPKVMHSNGIIPSVVFSTTYKIFTINVSPTFINAGLTFTLQN
jgi:hypothetical protein